MAAWLDLVKENEAWDLVDTNRLEQLVQGFHLKATGSGLKVVNAQVEVGTILSRLKIPSEPKIHFLLDLSISLMAAWLDLVKENEAWDLVDTNRLEPTLRLKLAQSCLASKSPLNQKYVKHQIPSASAFAELGLGAVA
jgi:hypothetical protein